GDSLGYCGIRGPPAGISHGAHSPLTPFPRTLLRYCSLLTSEAPGDPGWDRSADDPANHSSSVASKEGMASIMTAVESPEKILFASTSAAFLQKETPLSTVRQLHAAGVSFDPAWWQRAADLGWTGLLVPEELGGGSVSGDGLADLASVAEQM